MNFFKNTIIFNDKYKDLRKWILDNINMNPNEFTKSTVKYFENADLKKLQKGAPIIYLSSIEYKGELIKMGIISKNSFMNSCYNVFWRLVKATFCSIKLNLRVCERQGCSYGYRT